MTPYFLTILINFRRKQKLPFPNHFVYPDLNASTKEYIEKINKRSISLEELLIDRKFVSGVLTPGVNELLLYIDEENP